MQTYKLNFVFCDTHEQASELISQEFINQIKTGQKSVFIMPTGSSPCATYAKLVKDHQENHTSWNNVVTFNCDEYVVLTDKYPKQTYHYFMDEQLFNHVDIFRKNINFPDVTSINGVYLKAIQDAGKADICLLGIGVNGHIAFNEPGSAFDSLTRYVDLAPETIKANSRYFDNDINAVPKQALTMGLKTIIDGSKKIIVIATGANKKDIVKKLSTITEFDINVPASALLYHPNVHIYLDKDSDIRK